MYLGFSTSVISFTAFTAFLLCACGTQVDVGDNEEKGKVTTKNFIDSADAEAAEEETISIIRQPGSGVPNLGGTEGDASVPNLGGDSGGNEPGGEGEAGEDSKTSQPLTCFGSNPSIPYDFQTFCDDIPGDLKTEFQSAYALLCQDKKLINLALYDVCAWHGEDSDINKKRKVLAASDATDSSLDEFYLLSAYSLTSHSTPDQHLDLIRGEMTNPNFTDTYLQIRNSAITNTIEHDRNSYTYHVSLANSAATVSFTANLKFWQISDVLTVVFDYAVADRVILKNHQFLRFIIDLGNGQSRIVGVDEKKIEDGGQHSIAYSNLMDILHQRMEKDYENSTRD